ncbi:hypothetical protein [Limnovirga soli]|uniref:Uncharacterized protein n=1 Tax=Limnovirga soli TaxID=2656915 RepID=A0A8J8JRP4_9BACT|nr:hypothetical protein [Limnovirga soli]NNV56087.1 hypothetical protein [Limnovirga soli]
MIIRGQFKTFGFRFSLIAVIGGLISLIYFILFGVGNTPIAAQFFLYFVLILLLSIYGKLLYDANLISINTKDKTVTFVNIFTRNSSKYNYSDFDGKLVWYEPIRGGYVRNFYFIQNKKAVKKISGFIYSNQNDLEEELIDIKDFGTTKYSYLKSWKVFFSIPIID